MGMFDKFFKSKAAAPKATKTGRIQNDFDAHYFLGKTLGNGAFATVKEVVRKSDSQKFAVKIVDRSKLKDHDTMMQSEIAILQSISHPNIIALKDLYVTPTHYYLVMELASGGELFDRILAKGSYTEKDAASIVKQLISALAYLHEHNIVHRDLKPENMIFRDTTDESDILLTDFGLSKAVKTNQFLTTSCGTPHYVAPEILKDLGHGVAVDMWSIGVITYVLLCGYTPFWGGETNSTTLLYQSIVSGKFEFDEEYWGHVSSLAKEFISRLLIVDPSKRMTAKEALMHPWLSTQESVDLLPNVIKNFNAKKTFKKAVFAIASIQRANSMVSAGSRLTEE
ncbi:kinase-like domain-containing protein [Entophlyctis helioformis]|nr:kinase-like domain-containing protein [Entophlyctis helioformis]